MAQPSDEELEKQSEIPVPAFDESTVLIDLPIGDYVDCVVTSIQPAHGKMKSSMMHGISIPEKMPFKMWMGKFLEGAFERKPDLLNRLLRIRRLEDTDTGQSSGMKTYRISDLKELQRLKDKDKPSPVKK